MKELAAQNQVFSRRDVSKKEAMYLFIKKGDEYKTELIAESGRRHYFTLHPR